MASRWILVLTLGVCLGTASTIAVASTVPYPPYLGFGNDTLGPTLVIDLTASGASIVAGPGAGQGPYDGTEDTYIGVENTSGHTFTQISLHANSLKIFGFDGDGIQTFGSAGNASDSTGYAGPDNFFSNISPSLTDGNLNFIGGLLDGHSTYFSLEEPLDAASFHVSAVPLPAALPLLCGAVVGLGALSRFRRKTPIVAS
jgi:hypothetical protein